MADRDDEVITATLQMGKTYSLYFKGQYQAFVRNVPREVTAEIADELEKLVYTQVIPGGEGEEIEKDTFRIDRNAPRRSLEAPVKKLRLRLVPVTEKAEPVRPAPVRPVSSVKKPAFGGGRG